VRAAGARLRRGAVALAAAAAAAAAPAHGQERVESSTYANKTHGIEISKPAAWHFITAGMIVDLAKRSAGQTSLRGEEDPVKLTGIAVIASKTPSLGLEVTPHVILRVIELKEGSVELVQTCEGLRTGMGDPETVEPTRPVRLDGRPAVRLDFRGSVDGARVRATALCAVRGRRAYFVVGQALVDDFEAEARTFETILASFKLR
jgi:hypothetical protein